MLALILLGQRPKPLPASERSKPLGGYDHGDNDDERTAAAALLELSSSSDDAESRESSVSTGAVSKYALTIGAVLTSSLTGRGQSSKLYLRVFNQFVN